MSAPIIVKIGGESVTVPPIMNFLALERAWPAILAMNAEKDPIRVDAAAMAVLAAVLLESRPDLDVMTIKRRVLINRADGTDERQGIGSAVNQLMIISGLVTPGELEAATEKVAPEGAVPGAAAEAV